MKKRVKEAVAAAMGRPIDDGRMIAAVLHYGHLGKDGLRRSIVLGYSNGQSGDEEAIEDMRIALAILEEADKITGDNPPEESDDD